MQKQPSKQRILIKLSGESLSSKDNSQSLEINSISSIASKITQLQDEHYQLSIVIGGGNIFRGAQIQKDLDVPRVCSDSMGMLATVINAIALSQTLIKKGYKSRVFTSFSLNLPYVECFKTDQAIRALEDGYINIFAGGLGSPFFTTDSCAALRACEINADTLVKVTKVDGIYSDDPEKNPKAKRFDRITYTECLNQQLRIMDSTAFALCRDNQMPIVICHLNNIVEAITQEKNRTLVEGE
jgi:uridylate kinase